MILFCVIFIFRCRFLSPAYLISLYAECFLLSFNYSICFSSFSLCHYDPLFFLLFQLFKLFLSSDVKHSTFINIFKIKNQLFMLSDSVWFSAYIHVFCLNWGLYVHMLHKQNQIHIN